MPSIRRLRRRLLRLLAKEAPGAEIRASALRACGYSVGERAHIGEDLIIIDDPATPEFTLDVGDRASIAPRVTFVLHTQPNDSLIVPYVNCRRGSVTVGPDAWIGVGAVIMPGVTIGEGAVVGANSVVTRSVEPYTVVAGAPAHMIKEVVVPWRTPTTDPEGTNA